MSQTIRILAIASGEWSVESPESGLVGTYPTEGQAVARAWDIAKNQPNTALIVQSGSETTQSRLNIRPPDPLEARRYEYEDAEDERLCREAEKMWPSWDQLQAIKANLPRSTIDYSQEDDELPC